MNRDIDGVIQMLKSLYIRNKNDEGRRRNNYSKRTKPSEVV